MTTTHATPIRERLTGNRSRSSAVKPRGRSYEVRIRAADVPPLDPALRTIAQTAPPIDGIEAKLRIVVHPMLGPAEGLDVTQAVTRAVAQELWNLHGGNDVMNWLEAERLLGDALNAAASRDR